MRKKEKIRGYKTSEKKNLGNNMEIYIYIYAYGHFVGYPPILLLLFILLFFFASQKSLSIINTIYKLRTGAIVRRYMYVRMINEY